MLAAIAESADAPLAPDTAPLVAKEPSLGILFSSPSSPASASGN